MSGYADSIRAFYDAVNRGDLDALHDYAASSYTNHNLPPELPPDLHGAKEMFDAMRQGFPDLNFSVERVVESGDLAAAWMRVTGTHLQDFMGLAPTYNQFDIEGADFFRFSQDKAVEHWTVLDRLTMLYQLEVMPTEEEGRA